MFLKLNFSLKTFSPTKSWTWHVKYLTFRTGMLLSFFLFERGRAITTLEFNFIKFVYLKFTNSSRFDWLLTLQTIILVLTLPYFNAFPAHEKFTPANLKRVNDNVRTGLTQKMIFYW
jgi:hypothetical protein